MGIITIIFFSVFWIMLKNKGLYMLKNVLFDSIISIYFVQQLCILVLIVLNTMSNHFMLQFNSENVCINLIENNANHTSYII